MYHMYSVDQWVHTEYPLFYSKKKKRNIIYIISSNFVLIKRESRQVGKTLKHTDMITLGPVKCFQ